MNRFRKAWQALRGTLEPDEVVICVPVFSDPVMAKLYSVSVPDEDAGYVESSFDGRKYWNRHRDVYFATCEQAHSANAGYVREVKAIRVGSQFVVADELRFVDVQPKPKVAKGRK